MKKIKKILVFLILLFSFGFSFAAPDGGSVNLANGVNTANTSPDGGSVNLADGVDIKDKMSNPTFSNGDIENKLGVNSGNKVDGQGGILTQIINFARESIFNLLWVVVVGVLLYIGFRLIIGRGTPDIFKKAMMGLVYLIIGVILIYTSWAMVKVILGVSF